MLQRAEPRAPACGSAAGVVATRCRMMGPDRELHPAHCHSVGVAICPGCTETCPARGAHSARCRCSRSEHPEQSRGFRAAAARSRQYAAPEHPGLRSDPGGATAPGVQRFDAAQLAADRAGPGRARDVHQQWPCLRDRSWHDEPRARPRGGGRAPAGQTRTRAWSSADGSGRAAVQTAVVARGDSAGAGELRSAGGRRGRWREVAAVAGCAGQAGRCAGCRMGRRAAGEAGGGAGGRRPRWE